jgi:hypothetical protein
VKVPAGARHRLGPDLLVIGEVLSLQGQGGTGFIPSLAGTLAHLGGAPAPGRASGR